MLEYLKRVIGHREGAFVEGNKKKSDGKKNPGDQQNPLATAK